MAISDQGKAFIAVGGIIVAAGLAKGTKDGDLAVTTTVTMLAVGLAMVLVGLVHSRMAEEHEKADEEFKRVVALFTPHEKLAFLVLSRTPKGMSPASPLAVDVNRAAKALVFFDAKRDRTRLLGRYRPAAKAWLKRVDKEAALLGRQEELANEFREAVAKLNKEP